MNEVVPWSSRAAVRLGGAGKRTWDGVHGAWDWFTGLGLGAWLLTVGVLTGGAFILTVVMAQSPLSACDRTVDDYRSVNVYNGSERLTGEAADALHEDAKGLASAAQDASGQQRTALTGLAATAQGARHGAPFDATSSLAAYRDACY